MPFPVSRFQGNEKGKDMKVREVMTKRVAFCGPDTNLAEAVELMWTNACGFFPVAGEGDTYRVILLHSSLDKNGAHMAA